MWIPEEGFLGTGAPFAADVNLVVQVAMGVTLLVGAQLARRRRYRAHGIAQTTVLLLNLVMIALVMWPSTRQQVMPAFPRCLTGGISRRRRSTRCWGSWRKGWGFLSC
jgi:hypothetical protein